MIYKQFQDLQLSALGMGAMRLPVTTGIWEMVKYLLSTSKEAAVPPRLADRTAAPGLWEKASPPA